MKLKIAIVVHGRFHAFDLARALIARGHDVTLFTNYPKWAVERFGVPKTRVRSFWRHGVLSRAAGKLEQKNVLRFDEARLHSMFSRWAASEIEKEDWDVVHLWSGVAEDVMERMKGRPGLILMMRGSAHIRVQARLLEEEEVRTRVPQDRPSQWIIAREEREYGLADGIVTLSTFAFDSFLSQGVPGSRLELLPLASQIGFFRPLAEVVEKRCRRILSGEALRVLYVGALSFQKGLYDLASIVEGLHGKDFSFRFVGPAVQETSGLLSTLREKVEIVSKRPQHELPRWYAGSDVFVFPTIQDGYAVVLAQANTSALPILTTTNCGGPDLIKEGQTGWILPIREPAAFVERLLWCDTHREELAAMVRRIYEDSSQRDWNEVAADFEQICFRRLGVSDRKAASHGRQ